MGYCGAALGGATFNNGALECIVATDYSLHVISARPTPAQIAAICKVESCLKCLAAMRAAAPTECTVGRDLQLYADVLNPIAAQCGQGIVTPKPTPTPAPAPAPSAAPAPPPTTTAAPGPTATVQADPATTRSPETSAPPSGSSGTLTATGGSGSGKNRRVSGSGTSTPPATSSLVGSTLNATTTAPTATPTSTSARDDFNKVVNQIHDVQEKAISVGVIVLIAIVSILGVIAIAGFIILARSQRRKHIRHDNVYAVERTPVPQGPKQPGRQSIPPPSPAMSSVVTTTITESSHEPSSSDDDSHRPTTPVPSVLSDGSMGSAAWDDPMVVAARIPLDQVHYGEMLSRGAFGEVFRGEFRNEVVSIKRLLPARRKDMKEIEGFLAEVKLMSTLFHERIVRFIGVAWDSLTDLCAVTEFMNGGDLRSLLARYHLNGAPTGFTPEKVKIAVHVIHGLTYLHSVRPPIVHRDLKSKNVLLTTTLDAKLTDFGVSRERVDQTMTAGVGSMLWMAPEVMLGERYDEKADIFSFGALMSELDTQQLPYAHAKEPGTDRKLPEMAILQLVGMGRLEVAFTDTTLSDVVALGRSCVDVDPAARPTASELFRQLHSIYQSISSES